MDTESKLRILADAAKYDVACTSSGLTGKRSLESSAMRSRRESAIVFRRMGAVSRF